MFSTPTKDDGSDEEDNDRRFMMNPATPAPVKARVNNLTNQVSELVRAKENNEKRHRAAMSQQKNELEEAKSERDIAMSEAKSKALELERCKAEGDGKMHELNLQSEILQQRAALLLAQEQMQIIELERRLVQAEAERVLRDHRISMFEAHQDEMQADMDDKDVRIEALEARLASANTSAGHKEAADSKSRFELEARVNKLEATVTKLKASEKEARDELAEMLKAEKSNEGSADKEKKQLQASLKAVKADLTKKEEELVDAQEELSLAKESSKEREKALKQKLKEMTLEKDRLAGLEDELEALRTSTRVRTVSSSVPPQETPAIAPKKDKAKNLAPIVMAPIIQVTAPEEDEVVEKPKKVKEVKAAPVPKTKVRKASPIPEEAGSDHDTPSPKKRTKTPTRSSPRPRKARTPARSVSPQPPVAAAAAARKAKALGENDDNLPAEADDGKIGEPFKVMKPLVIKKKAKDKETLDEDAQPDKKKKRKLLGVQPAFQWDSIMNSGDGVIPSTLSPLKPTATKTGTIPRVGFPSATSSRSLNRF